MSLKYVQQVGRIARTTDVIEERALCIHPNPYLNDTIVHRLTHGILQVAPMLAYQLAECTLCEESLRNKVPEHAVQTNGIPEHGIAGSPVQHVSPYCM